MSITQLFKVFNLKSLRFVADSPASVGSYEVKDNLGNTTK